MIKILKEGTKKKCECYECGCLFSFDKEDVKMRKGEFGGEKSSINCPQCSTEIILNSTR